MKPKQFIISAGKKSIFLLILNCCFSVAGSSNGRMQLSESCHLGSSPSPAAKFQNRRFRQNAERRNGGYCLK